jgi:hypothetical protein
MGGRRENKRKQMTSDKIGYMFYYNMAVKGFEKSK